MNALARTRHHVHNSLLALSAVCAISGACLLAARPLPAPIPGTAGAELAVAGAVLTAGTALAGCEKDEITADARTDAEDEATTSREPRRHGRRGRQPLAMPYFSFAARS